MRVPRARRPSPQTIAVLNALAASPREWRYGYDLCVELGLKAGSMYPILMRLADRGLLATAWESEARPGRPPRHLYRITRTGQQLAAEIESESTAASRARSRLRPEGA